MLNCEQVRELLDAYHDSRLDSDQAAEVADHLQQCSSCEYQSQVTNRIEVQLRDLYRDEPVPTTLWPRIQASFRQANQRSKAGRHTLIERPIALAAALLLFIAVGLTLSQFLPPTDDPEQLVKITVSELRTFVAARRQMDFTSTDPLALRGWFVDKVDFTPPSPPMVDKNVALIGGRLCTILGQRVISYMYRVDGQLVSLYIMAAPEDPGKTYPIWRNSDRLWVEEVQGFAHVGWIHSGLHYALVTTLPKDRSVALARKLGDYVTSDFDHGFQG